jgi:hypothetical protein
VERDQSQDCASPYSPQPSNCDRQTRRQKYCRQSNPSGEGDDKPAVASRHVVNKCLCNPQGSHGVHVELHCTSTARRWDPRAEFNRANRSRKSGAFPFGLGAVSGATRKMKFRWLAEVAWGGVHSQNKQRPQRCTLGPPNQSRRPSVIGLSSLAVGRCHPVLEARIACKRRQPCEPRFTPHAGRDQARLFFCAG